MILSIFETFFDSSVQEEEKNIQLDGYGLLRTDHPSNSKQGGVCIFYKETLGVCIVKSSSLMNALFVKSLYKIARAMLVLYVRCLSQDSFEFESFFLNLKKVLNDATFCNYLFTLFLGEFNARSSVWWTRDKTRIEGTQLASLTTVHGFHQLISHPPPPHPPPPPSPPSSTTTNFILHWFNIY